MNQPNQKEIDRTAPRESSLLLGNWYHRSPFFEATQRYGASAYDVYNHMLLPSRYDRSEDAEEFANYWHLVEDVALWDVSVERVVEISGPDAAAFTDRLTPRDLTECAIGQCKYAPLTASDGGIVNDPVLLRPGEEQFWLCMADSDAGLWIRGIAHDSDYDVEIDEPDIYPVQVQGPKSVGVIEELFGPPITDLEYYHCGAGEVDGIPVTVSRTGWTGERGYEIYLQDPARGDDLWEAIMDAGRQYDIRPQPPSNIRRIEAGIFNYQSDIRLEHNPYEVTGMERLVELDETGDFVGREALERIESEGVDRKLVGIEFDGEVPNWITQPWSARHDGREVGEVTAATYSPRLEQSIGYVWVPIDLADPGSGLVVETADGDRLTGATASLPFYDPEKEIPSA